MPFIHVRTNTAISAAQEAALKTQLGQAITLLPGKSESWLMLQIEGGCHLYFRGEQAAPLAFVEVKLFGRATAADYERMTAEVTRLLADELGIAPDGVYVKYEEVAHWGWNGRNL